MNEQAGGRETWLPEARFVLLEFLPTDRILLPACEYKSELSRLTAIVPGMPHEDRSYRLLAARFYQGPHMGR